jgi:hypothetical protein
MIVYSDAIPALRSCGSSLEVVILSIKTLSHSKLQ